MQFVSPTNNNLAAVAAQLTAPQLWQKLVDRFEQTNDYFQSLESSEDRPDGVVVAKTELSAGKGHTLNIRVRSGYYHEPKMADELFTTAADFETEKFGEYQLAIEVYRNAAANYEITEEKYALRDELKANMPEELGAWMGRQKSELVFMNLREKLNAENILFSNQKTMATLKSADILNWNNIVIAGGVLKRLGGTPARMGRTQNGGAPVMRYLVAASSDTLMNLELDSTYQSLLNATEKGITYQFSGEFSDVRGHIIRPYNPIDHDGQGAIASPLNPKAYLSAAVTAGTAVFDILGGGVAAAATDTATKFFKYFLGHAYRFTAADTLAANKVVGTTADFTPVKYVLIVNPPNAPTDPGKIGMYSYTTGNNGNKITIVERLGSAASVARVTTLGSVVWNTGVWSGKHTDVHPIGALVIQCNAFGTPIGFTPILGRSVILRGYGKYRNKRGQESEEDGFVNRCYIRSYMGHKIRQDRLARCPGVALLVHAVTYPDQPLPTVT